jgi:hypothetical protein
MWCASSKHDTLLQATTIKKEKRSEEHGASSNQKEYKQTKRNSCASKNSKLPIQLKATTPRKKPKK